MTRAEIVERLTQRLSEEPPNLLAAYLFGSVARGDDHAGSDVDVGLLFARTPEPTLMDQPFGLEGDLELLVGRTVQAVVLNTAPVDLVHRVLRDGILLLDRDKSHRIAFEVRTRNEYFDLLPFLRRYRRMDERTGAPS